MCRFTDTPLLTARIHDNPWWKMLPRRRPRHRFQRPFSIGPGWGTASQTTVIHWCRGFIAMPFLHKRDGSGGELWVDPPENGWDAHCSHNHHGLRLALHFMSRTDNQAGLRRLGLRCCLRCRTWCIAMRKRTVLSILAFARLGPAKAWLIFSGTSP